jgi:hypothetical protein
MWHVPQAAAIEKFLAVRRVPQGLPGSFYLHAAKVGDHLPDFFFRHADTLLGGAIWRHRRARDSFIDGPEELSVGVAVPFVRPGQVRTASSTTRAEPMAERAIRAKLKLPELGGLGIPRKRIRVLRAECHGRTQDSCEGNQGENASL